MFYTSDFKITNKEEGFNENVNQNFQEKAVKPEISWKEYFIELLDEYCQYGSLHGLRYLREPSIPRTERFLWLGVFLTSLYFSWILVWKAYNDGATHTFTLDINPESTPIWDIPFPAVLVCSAYPIRKSVFDIAKEGDNVKYMQFSKLVCPNKLAFGSKVYNETIGEDFFEFIHKAAIPCQDLIVNCLWRGKKRDCCTYFKPILTPFGFCYVFNSLPGELKFKHYRAPPGAVVSHDDDFMFWTLERGYPRRDAKQAKLVRPLWSEFGGPHRGLTFDLVDVREEWQENCSGSVIGFQLAVYPPNECFESEPIIKIPHNEHFYITLHPNLVLAEENLKSIDKEERECVFNDEVTLDYFSQYSQSTCHLECFIQRALQVCGCVIFSAYRMVGRYNHPYCSDSQYTCLAEEINSLIARQQSDTQKTRIYSKCMCVPACSWLNYDYQTGFEPIITATTLPPWAEGYNKSFEENFARVSIYFHEERFNTLDRKRTSTLGNFLGNCGGLLGLFLGFSFMSLFEVIYFALMRPLNRMITLYWVKSSYN